MSVAVNSGVAWNGLSKRLAIETSALDVGGRLRAEPALLKFHATSSDKSVMSSKTERTERVSEYLRRVASAYDVAQHEPESAIVRHRYGALKIELWNQYNVLGAFVDILFTLVDPYESSAAMMTDIDVNQRLSVYTIADIPHNHPFSEMSEAGVTYNSIFRAVHDGLAHYPERNGFGKLGEFKAFRAHARLLSPNATQALFTETVAQNAWYHFGGDGNTFAPQRATLMPDELINEALTLEI